MGQVFWALIKHILSDKVFILNWDRRFEWEWGLYGGFILQCWKWNVIAIREITNKKTNLREKLKSHSELIIKKKET